MDGVVAPVDHRMDCVPQPPVIAVALKVELPGAQYVEGEAAILKLIGTKVPGQTND